MPEMWGYMQFSDIKAVQVSISLLQTRIRIRNEPQDGLLYRSGNFKKFNTYTSELKLLGLGKKDFSGIESLPVIKIQIKLLNAIFLIKMEPGIGQYFRTGELFASKGISSSSFSYHLGNHILIIRTHFLLF